MPTAILDTLKGSSLNFTLAEPSEKVRGGLVTGLTGDPSRALDQCLTADGMPALGDPIDIGGKTVYFRRLQVEPTEAPDTAGVKLIYDNNISGLNTAFTITVHGYEQAYQTNRLPGTREPLIVPKWFPAGGQAGNLQQAPVESDLATGTFAYPMRQVTIAGIRQGQTPPLGTYDGAIGGVNQKIWLGLGTGMWRVIDGMCTSSIYSGYFSYSVSAVTKNIEDWSEIRQLYSQRFGFWVKLPAADEQKLKDGRYNYGIFVSVPGAIRFGPYPLVDFDPIFGSILGAKATFGSLGGSSAGTRTNT